MIAVAAAATLGVIATHLSEQSPKHSPINDLVTKAVIEVGLQLLEQQPKPDQLLLDFLGLVLAHLLPDLGRGGAHGQAQIGCCRQKLSSVPWSPLWQWLQPLARIPG